MIKLSFLTGVILVLISCSQSGTDSGNPIITLSVQSYSTSSVGKVNALAVSGFTFCFKRLRFKMATDPVTTNPENDEDNIDLNLGSIAIDPSGTSLGSVRVPAGTYSRIEFDLRSDCAGVNSPSVILDNSNDGGTPFETNDQITIKFDGLVTISANTNIDLQLDSILTALNAVTTDAEIKTRLEDISTVGSF